MEITKDRYQLTDKELKAAVLLTQSAMDGCGANRPSDFEYDEYTWVSPSDLIDAGYSKNEAAGFWSSLLEKTFICDMEDGTFCIVTPGWKWIDLIWDEVNK